MELPVETIGDVLIVTVQNDVLDANEIDDFKRDIAPIIEGQHKVLLDLSYLRFVDSAGIGAILTCLRRISEVNGELKMCSPTKGVRSAFEITRLHRIIDILNTREQALAAFKQG
jgi:anti-sigma B factor antagonist